MEMKELKVRITFTESVLGSTPANEDIYRDYIATKAEDPKTIEDEVKALGVEAVAEKGKTIFPKLEDGTPFMYDYQIKGFFKDTCGGLRKVPGTCSSKIKAFKKEIDKLIFIKERKIPIVFEGEIGECQRPLRASTAQGERVSIAISEEIPAGATMEFTICYFLDEYGVTIREWLDYGVFSGLGQWRNASHGRFTWKEIKGGRKKAA